MTAPARPEVVTLCGSMRVFPRMLQVAAAETAAGAVVLAPFPIPDAHAGDGDVAAMLDDLHRRKIDMTDRVVVVTDATGSCGSATTAEVAYARARGIPVHTRQVHEDARGTQGGDVW